MAARRDSPIVRPVSDHLLDPPDTSLLDLLDRVLSKGVMANGDLTLGVAGVDLIYVRLAALICAADRILVPDDPAAESQQRQARSRTKPEVPRQSKRRGRRPARRRADR